jgi:hypothetical protein
MKLATELRSDSSRRPTRSAVSECWVYTIETGLREITLASAQHTLTIDGHVLRPWYLLDPNTIGCALATLYSLEPPSRELRERVLTMARERFQNRAWYRALVKEA